ncbi:KpsF/GutQ family sugar-phosphate isomerase [Neisseria sp. Ec49-e6-T10]|uniref:KpsF/GutQ family sugar-phosphate isomerase n=1 Tax=Neisseria sp. Ec49-e6-T10 TaxID=3140744 RepID=UPI003EBD0D58
MNTSQSAYLKQAQDVLNIEASALVDLSNQLDESFTQAIDLILGCTGRLIVTGMGKSGHIGTKIAATMASTGTPSFFVHPAEAAHGDLGMIVQNDIVLALSNSGESEEVIALLPALKRKGTKIIAITGRTHSTLAKEADIHLNAAVKQEACPLGLAPTTSTTAALALGDALAVVLLSARKFTPEDFALSHPAGSLGKRLLIHVADLMHKEDDLPQVKEGATLQNALLIMTEKGLGMTAVTNEQGQLIGVFTDGDLRRIFQKTANLTNIMIDDVMSKNPKTISANKLASEALHMMQTYKVSALLITNEQNHLIGAINMHDLLQAGII